jgi:hypothetical protein
MGKMLDVFGAMVHRYHELLGQFGYLAIGCIRLGVQGG